MSGLEPIIIAMLASNAPPDIVLAGPAVMPLVAMLASTAVQQIVAVSTKPDDPKPLPAPEPPAEVGNEGALLAERYKEQKRRDMYAGGRPSTIKNPLGLPGTPPTAGKLLTGA